MNAGIFEKGWNFSQDGPGHRLVYHFQGCNLRCPWCSNPEGIALSGTLVVDPDTLLDTVCPHGAIAGQCLDRARCAGCAGRECIGKNINQGIRLSCKEYDLYELVAEVRESRPLFFDGGGVTLTGGEPTMQFEFVQQFLIHLKDTGINTAIETNGTHERLNEIFSLVDTLIIDCKHYDSERHAAILGRNNETVLANIRSASGGHPGLLIRIPLIPGFNACETDIDRFIALFKAMNLNHAPVELLAYHEYGMKKWYACGMEPYAAAVAPIDIEQYRARFAAAGFTVVRT